MVGPIQSERTSNPAAAIVARLLHGYFGAPRAMRQKSIAKLLSTSSGLVEQTKS